MTWSLVENAILAYWVANTTFAAPLRALDAYNGPAFRPPAIVPATWTDAIWCRLTNVPIPRSTRPFGIGSAAWRYYEGLVYRQIFYPRGFGEGAAVDAFVESEVALFHRQSLAAGVVRFRDCYAPERVPPTSDDAAWAQINVVNPYYVIDPATAEN